MYPHPCQTANAGVDSYPTFWDVPADHHPTLPVQATEAYSTFVNLTEEELPDMDTVEEGCNEPNDSAHEE